MPQPFVSGCGGHTMPRRLLWVLSALVATLTPFAGLLVADGRFVSNGDYGWFYLPLESFSRDEVLCGRFPIWLPFLTCGAPLHAEQHATLLYPPSASLVLIAGANNGVKISLFLHVALCFAGQYGLSRELAISSPASVFAAVGGVWGTFAMDHLAAGHVACFNGYALMPWFFWLLLRFLAQPSAGRAAVLAGATSLMQLGGHPQIFYYTLLGGASWSVGWLLSRRPRVRRRGLCWLAAAAITSLMTTAAQWVPAAELVQDGAGRSQRGTVEYATMYSMDGGDLARVVVPRFKGDRRLGIEPFDHGSYEHERSAYSGIIVLPLAAFGLSRAKAARWQFCASWLCLIAAEIALAGQSPFWQFFRSVLPGLVWFRCQGRIFSVIGIMAPLVAARGLDSMVRGDPTAKIGSLWHFVALLSAGVAAVAGGIHRWLSDVDWNDYVGYASVHLRHEYRNFSAMLLLVGIVLFACRALRNQYRKLAYALPIVMLMGDFYEHNVRHFELVAVDAASSVRLPRGVAPERFVAAPRNLGFNRRSLQYSWILPFAIASRTPAVNTFDGAVLPRAVSRLFQAIEREPNASLALAACHWVYIESEDRWVEISEALPRFRVLCGPAAMLCHRAIEKCGDDDVASLRRALGGTVIGYTETPCRLAVDVVAPADGMFVLADTYYPGWHCTVDGANREIFPAHGIFRGVPVRAGRHRIEFQYRPRSFRVGLWMSAIGLGTLLSVAAFAVWPGRKRPTCGASP